MNTTSEMSKYSLTERKRIIRQVRQQCEQRGIKSTELAEQTGISKSAMGKLLTKKGKHRTYMVNNTTAEKLLDWLTSPSIGEPENTQAVVRHRDMPLSGELKTLREVIARLEAEIATKDERIAHADRENRVLNEALTKVTRQRDKLLELL